MATVYRDDAASMNAEFARLQTQYEVLRAEYEKQLLFRSKMNSVKEQIKNASPAFFGAVVATILYPVISVIIW